MKYLILCVIPFLLASCRPSSVENADAHLPSENYTYIKEVPQLPVEKKSYVPIYSDIYILTGKRKYPLTATLSVRNTSSKDTLYIRTVDYYSSKGKLLKQYISDVLLLTPYESVEFIVAYNESQGGPGANFIINWASKSTTLLPVIQAVMIGNSDGTGISFLTEGVDVH